MRKYYVGLDVHKVSIAIAVLDAHGKLVTEISSATCGEKFISLSKKETTPPGSTTSSAIKQRGRELYHVNKRQSWLEKLSNPGQRTRAELFFQQLDELKVCISMS